MFHNPAQVELEELRRIGRKAYRGVSRLALFNKSESLVIKRDGEIFGLAKCGIKDERYGHGIEQRGHFALPKMVERFQGICDRRFLAKDAAAPGSVELQHGRHIQRRHDDGNAGREYDLGGSRIGFDVPFRFRFRPRFIPASNRASHQRDLLGLSGRLGISLNQRRHVGKFADGNDGNLSRVAMDLAAQKFHRAACLDLGTGKILGPAA